MSELSLAVGDTITLEKADGGLPEYLHSGEFVIVGIVNHPDHASLPIHAPGNRNVIVLPEAFNTDATDGCFMKAIVSIESTAGKNRFEKSYLDSVNETVDRLKALGRKREQLRTEDVRGRYQSKIDNGQSQLDAAEEALLDASNTIESNQDQIIDGEQELSEAKETLDALPAQLEEAEQALIAGREELARGQEQVSASKKELDAALKKLNDGEAQIVDSKQQLEAADAQLKDAKTQLDDAERQLKDGEKKLDDAHTQLQNGRAELISTYRQIEESKNEFRGILRRELYGCIGDMADRIPWYQETEDVDPDKASATAMKVPITDTISLRLNDSLYDDILFLVNTLSFYGVTFPEGSAKTIYENAIVYLAQYERLADAASAWDAGHADYLDGKAQYQEGLQEYNHKAQEYQIGLAKYHNGLSEFQIGLTKYNQARSELDAGWREYKAGLEKLHIGETDLSEGEAVYESRQQEYEDGVVAFEEGKRSYEEGQKQLESGRAALADGKKQYEANYAAYESGVAELADARASLENLSDCHWIVLDMNGNISYMLLSANVRNMRGMGMTFSLVFILVGALVIFTTVSRIVEEQRKLIGTEKALGLFYREILFKYLFYGVSGTVLGTLLGLLVGYLAVQRIMLFTYGRIYVFESGKLAFRPFMTMIVLAAAIVLSGTTIWIACWNLIRVSSINLLQGVVPKSRTMKEHRHKKGGSLYSRMVWNNMISDKNRVIVSIASIAGCCALLVAGFTMKSSVMKSLARQFDEIEHYDLKVGFDPQDSNEAKEKLQALLDDACAEWMAISDQALAFSCDGELDSAEVMCGDLLQMSSYFTIHDPETNAVLSGEGEGIWINKCFAETIGLKAGDTFTLYDSAMDPHKIPVAGVFNMHIGRQMVISEENYEAFLGKAPIKNMFLIRCGIADGQKLRDLIREVKGIESMTDIEEQQKIYKSYASLVDVFALLFTVIAGMMAYFILLNIINMYVNQKKTELIIMRINGFTVREVLLYVSMELVVSTVSGVVIGWGAGSLLAYRVIRLIESENLHLVRSIQWTSWIWAALITLVFMAAISFLALRRIPRLKLTDAA